MKGFKTIFGVLATASLLFSFNASAQENNNRDENGKIVRGAYETNRALDNTFITIAGGINSVFDDSPAGSNPTDPSKYVLGKIGFGTEIDFGKWFTPSVGARFGWHGCNNEPKIGPWNQASEMQLPWNFIHGDLLWNISNAIGGYKETRFWDIIPYMSAGVLWIGYERKGVPNKEDYKNIFYNQEFCMGPGVINKFRINNRISAVLDLGWYVSREAAFTGEGYYDGVKDITASQHVASGKYISFPTATFGLQFNLFKTNWDRHSSITPTIIPVPFTLDQYNTLKDRVAALEAENAALKDKIAALEAENAKYKNLLDNGKTYIYQDGNFVETEATVATPAIVYFDRGSAKISDRELAHIEFYAENALDSDTELLLVGSADKATGNAKINQKLSEQRCANVKNVLTSKHGIAEGNIECQPEGDTNNIFDTPAKNRCVVIRIK
ncbi:MAG: OmpA family protein [Bacteroidales bacterium]|nr:OmpA family protein [Bacteroidales bacterium]